MKIRPLGLPSTGAFISKAASKVVAEPSQDVLDVRYPCTQEIAREGLKGAGLGLKLLGLPALGAALAGPVGLVVGLTASTVAKVQTRPALKQVLLSVGVGSALGMAGLALGPVAGAALALIPTLAGAVVGARGASRKDAEVSVRPEAFAGEYLTRVNQAVAGAKPGEPQQIEAPAPGASPKQCAEAVLKAFQLAANNLPSGAALTLAGESARQLLSPSDLERFDRALLRAVDKQGKVYDGQEILAGDVPLKKIRSSGPSPALAANQLVMMDEKFARETDGVTRDLVLGHELSHVRHKDAAFKQGVQTLTEMLSLASTPGNLALVLVKVILQGMLANESKAMELRADREGFEYARGQGHSPEEIQAAAVKLFGQGSDQAGMFDSHPAGLARIQALAELNKPVQPKL